MRSRPYRNDRIITAIRALYFAGGAKSFAKRFRYLFPTYEAREGEFVYEVPICMVALVATAVSYSCLFFVCYAPCSPYIQAVRHSLRVAHGRTAGHRVLCERIFGRISWPCKYLETYSREAHRRIPLDDG